MVTENNIESMFLTKGQRWHKDVCSEKQREFILNLVNLYKGKKEIKLETNDLSQLSKGDAGCLINVLRYETNT